MRGKLGAVVRPQQDNQHGPPNYDLFAGARAYKRLAAAGRSANLLNAVCRTQRR